MKQMLFGMLLLVLAGCQSTASKSDESPALYQALGERSGIEAVVEDLLFLIVDDERIAFQFRGIDVADFHQSLSDQICELSGGPCSYTGMNMREAHEGMDISARQFNALVEQLILAMERNDVPTGAQNRLLGKLAPMHDDIRGR